MLKMAEEVELDIKKMPLGKISLSTIMAAFKALQQIANLIEDPSEMNDFAMLSSTFYTIIPHDFGRRAPPIIKTQAMLASKINMLQILQAISYACTLWKACKLTPNPLESLYASLNVQLVEVKQYSDVFTLVQNYLTQSTSPMHAQYKLSAEHIYEVNRNGEKEIFEAQGRPLGNVMLLWHGAPVTSTCSILANGITCAPVSSTL